MTPTLNLWLMLSLSTDSASATASGSGWDWDGDSLPRRSTRRLSGLEGVPGFASSYAVAVFILSTASRTKTGDRAATASGFPVTPRVGQAPGLGESSRESMRREPSKLLCNHFGGMALTS